VKFRNGTDAKISTDPSLYDVWNKKPMIYKYWGNKRGIETANVPHGFLYDNLFVPHRLRKGIEKLNQIITQPF